MKGMGLIALTLFILIVSILVGGWGFAGFTMTSSAMDPTFAQGKMVFVSRIAKGIGRGTIVLAQVPGEETQVVRRIIGLPGEGIEYRNGEVFINGQKIEEKYLGPGNNVAAQFDVPAPENFGPFQIPDGAYFLMGDNRRFARDSRAFYAVKAESILGVVLSFGGMLVF